MRSSPLFPRVMRRSSSKNTTSKEDDRARRLGRNPSGSSGTLNSGNLPRMPLMPPTSREASLNYQLHIRYIMGLGTGIFCQVMRKRALTQVHPAQHRVRHASVNLWS